MNTKTDTSLARVTAIVGEPSRAAILEALLGGEWLPAGELARRARVAPATASGHLARLVEHGLIARRRAGRHRYYALAGPDVAAALEALARVAPPAGAPPDARPRVDPALRFARTCYDHLAGRLGVLVTDALIGQGLLAADGYGITERGEAWFGRLAIDLEPLRRGRRALARPCLDWTERRDHLAGAVGAALAATMLERRWLVRMKGTRAVRLTARGREGLYRALGLEIEEAA